ncbi:prolyl oligopeptidase family serine peptidase [Actinomyces faecalis]|uniref:prolyl oligopeptidase family serine peptidase n=1 Tax=Actinomyces faecalis TaxID=2722820 RepID=UPI001555C5D4|nr:prolyl oligopeptidase family serine peptidase [Actinomyces faecalis]
MPAHPGPVPLPSDLLAPAWLEEVTGRRATAWVEAHNRATRERFNDPATNDLTITLQRLMDCPGRIPVVSSHHGMLYGLWTDADHPRGIWRRTTWLSYVAGAPSRADRAPGHTQWEELLDVDALSATSTEPLAWAGAQVLSRGPLTGCRALVSLSQGGSDATSVQEYDLEQHRFIPASEGGFTQAPSKGMMTWADDTGQRVLVSGGLPDRFASAAGLPRQVRRLTRGQRMEDAEVLVTASADSLAAVAARDPWGRTWLTTVPSWDRTRIWLLPDSAYGESGIGDRLLDDGGEHVPAGAVRLEVPDSARAGVGRDWLTIELHDPWCVQGRTYRPGTLLAAPLDAYLAGQRDLEVLFEPTSSCVLASATWTRHHLVLTILDDVVTRLEVCTPPRPDSSEAPQSGWLHHDLDLTGAADVPGPPDTPCSELRAGRALLTVSAQAVDPADTDEGDYVWISATGWTTPSSLAVARLSDNGHVVGMRVVRQAPARFDARGVDVTQHVAVSADGTLVPYFQVGRTDPLPASPRHHEQGAQHDQGADVQRDGQGQQAGGCKHPRRVLLHAYGGFGHVTGPRYEPVMGKAWLEAGGTYVLACVRGGGEYGPAWHEAGRLAARHHVVEDLEAVVDSLHTRGVASPSSLTVSASSAGALGVGALMCRRPHHVGAVVLEAPLTDLGRYPHLLAGASWIGELGDPDDPQQWTWIRKLSPLHQVSTGVRYPPLLVLASSHDDRVHPWHARALVHRLEELGQPVWYEETTEGGHHSGVTSAQTARTAALTYTFAWEHTTSH